jgi:LPXTG-site transpeptidase (sortase) family protein
VTEVPSPPLHINYPAVGMDQDVLPLSPTAQEKSTDSIVPPTTLDAYWLTPYGSPGPGSINTTYIVGHSWEGRSTAFNNVTTHANVGDQLMLATAKGTLSYAVTSITTENKDTLKDSRIWAKVPGRLILITCYTEDLWGTNIIVEASPLPYG